MKENILVALPYREKVGEDVKVSELQGTDQQEIHITLVPENQAEKALVQILDQAQAQFSVDDLAEAGLIITAKIKSR